MFRAKIHIPLISLYTKMAATLETKTSRTFSSINTYDSWRMLLFDAFSLIHQYWFWIWLRNKQAMLTSLQITGPLWWNNWSPMDSPHKGPPTQWFYVFFDAEKQLLNSQDAGDFRGLDAHVRSFECNRPLFKPTMTKFVSTIHSELSSERVIFLALISILYSSYIIRQQV